MSQPVFIHHDQRRCSQVLGEHSPGQHPSLRSPRSRALASVSPWALWGPDLEKQTPAHTTLTPCCQRGSAKQNQTPVGHVLQLLLHSCKDPQSCSSRTWHPRHRDKCHVGLHSVGWAQTEQILLLSQSLAICSSLSSLLALQAQKNVK